MSETKTRCACACACARLRGLSVVNVKGNVFGDVPGIQARSHWHPLGIGKISKTCDTLPDQIVDSLEPP